MKLRLANELVFKKFNAISFRTKCTERKDKLRRTIRIHIFGFCSAILEH